MQRTGPVSENYAAAIGTHGQILHNLGAYEQAETLYRKAQAVDEKTIGTEHPDYAPASTISH